jgi:hypothetical protein
MACTSQKTDLQKPIKTREKQWGTAGQMQLMWEEGVDRKVETFYNEFVLTYNIIYMAPTPTPTSTKEGPALPTKEQLESLMNQLFSFNISLPENAPLDSLRLFVSTCIELKTRLEALGADKLLTAEQMREALPVVLPPAKEDSNQQHVIDEILEGGNSGNIRYLVITKDGQEVQIQRLTFAAGAKSFEFPSLELWQQAHSGLESLDPNLWKVGGDDEDAEFGDDHATYLYKKPSAQKLTDLNSPLPISGVMKMSSALSGMAEARSLAEILRSKTNEAALAAVEEEATE